MNIRIYQINPERDKNHVKFESQDSLLKLQGSYNIDSSIYDEVFNADIDGMDLESIYMRFNTVSHPLHRGHSLSISDVVVVGDGSPILAGRIRFYNSPTAYEECSYTDADAFLHAIKDAGEVGRTIEVDDLRGKNFPIVKPGAYFCSVIGFRNVEFDESLTHKPDNLMRVIYVEPHKPAYIAEVEDTLEGIQRAVGGGLFEPLYNDDGTVIVCNDEGKLIGMEGNRRIGSSSIIAGPFFVCGTAADSFRSLTEEEVVKYMDRFSQPEDISQDEVQRDIGITFYSW